MWDTHCHLTDPRLAGQLAGVLERAVAAGVTRMVTVGTDPADWDAALAVTKGRSTIRCALGAHPNNCREMQLSDVGLLRGYAASPSVVALGEMGLDYHYDFAPKERQREFFEAQLQLARELDKPVVIHCREAMEDCLTIVKSFSGVLAVFHCFTGSQAEADRIFELGHLIGLGGVVTFKNAAALREIGARAPADRILMETDAPYLSPEPMRKQKTNEPALVMYTAEAVAKARGVELAELDEITSRNAAKFYRWAI
jgi:TatD DNase family protein